MILLNIWFCKTNLIKNSTIKNSFLQSGKCNTEPSQITDYDFEVDMWNEYFINFLECFRKFYKSQMKPSRE
jgi:hypothetical protein